MSISLSFKNYGGFNGKQRKKISKREKNSILIKYNKILQAAERKAPYNK